MKVDLSSGPAYVRIRFGEDKHHRRTTTLILEREGDTRTSVATCSKKDTFVRRVGRKEALAKLVKESDIPKQDRVILWQNIAPEVLKFPVKS